MQQDKRDTLHTNATLNTKDTTAISLSVCVQGVGMRAARVEGRCTVVWLASEWCSVCCTCTEGSPWSCVRSQSLIVLGLVASEHTLSHPYLPPPEVFIPPYTHTVSILQLVMFRTVHNADVYIALQYN